MAIAATGGTSADSQRNHLHLMTTNDQRQQARGGEKANGGGTDQERGEQMEHATGKRRGRDIRLADTGVHATSQTDSTCGNTHKCRLESACLPPPPCWVVPTQVLHLSLLKSVNVCRHLW
ncbi:hypothetical protein GQ42DRAFT_160427 [Ramicandelaber brevisporus]|nr:hypothetical protein GQ42DRAFT_160427 [Ramicandelaber brevisporus]